MKSLSGEVLGEDIVDVDVGMADDEGTTGEKHDNVGDNEEVGVDDIVEDKGIIGEKHEQVGEHWEVEVCIEEVDVEVGVEVLVAGVKLDRRLNHEESPPTSLPAPPGARDAVVL